MQKIDRKSVSVKRKSHLHIYIFCSLEELAEILGVIQKPRGQEEVDRWSKICHFCPCLLHKKSRRRQVVFECPPKMLHWKNVYTRTEPFAVAMETFAVLGEVRLYQERHAALFKAFVFKWILKNYHVKTLNDYIF